jgi:hypothetical protein
MPKVYDFELWPNRTAVSDVLQQKLTSPASESA